MGCAFNIGTFINAIAPKIGNAFLAALLKNSLLDWIFLNFPSLIQLNVIV